MGRRENRAGERGRKKRESRKGEASKIEWIKASTRGGNKERTKKVEEVGVEVGTAVRFNWFDVVR